MEKEKLHAAIESLKTLITDISQERHILSEREINTLLHIQEAFTLMQQQYDGNTSPPAPEISVWGTVTEMATTTYERKRYHAILKDASHPVGSGRNDVRFDFLLNANGSIAVEPYTTNDYDYTQMDPDYDPDEDPDNEEYYEPYDDDDDEEEVSGDIDNDPFKNDDGAIII